MTHICVSDLTIIGSDNGLSPGRRQAIIGTNAGILSIRPLGTNLSDILIEILIFSFKKMRLKMSSAKRQPFCLGFNVLMRQLTAACRIQNCTYRTIITYKTFRSNLPVSSSWNKLRRVSSTNGTDCVANMEALICDIRCWYVKNMLKLNYDKTEMLFIGSKYHQIPQISDLHIGSGVSSASHVKNLGVIVGSNFTMEPHIKNIMRAAFFKIREISYYRRFSTPSCAKTLMHVYISSTIAMAFLWVTLSADQQTSDYF